MFFLSITTILLLSSCPLFFQTICQNSLPQTDYKNFGLNTNNNTPDAKSLFQNSSSNSTGHSQANRTINPADYESENSQEEYQEETKSALPKIRNIYVLGNKLVPTQAILAKIPYKKDKFFDPANSRKLITNVYSLDFFSAVDLGINPVDDNLVDLYIQVQEKPKVESVTYENAYAISPDEIEKKLKISEVSAMDQQEAELYAEKIKKQYAEKNYHNVKIETKLEPTERNTVIVKYTIEEGPKSVVKRVNFVGNNAFSSKKLSGLIFTREDWLLGFMNKAGSYQPDALEFDKHMIESFYQNHGYLAAKVTDIDVKELSETGSLSVTFHIDEGDIYTINSVGATGNELLSQEEIIQALPIKPGQLYNRELIRESIELLQATWGRFGYIYSDVDPEITPNFENKTVDIVFHSELGKPVKLRRINIIGNIKTRDYVLRRKLDLEEGQILTTQTMEASKSEIEKLGFFEPKTGVTWRTTKVEEGIVDLDLVLQEVKTGRIYASMGYGGNEPNVPNSSFQVTLGVNERNFRGTGVMTNLNLTFSKQNRSALFSIFQPWLFNYPIGSGFDVYHRKTVYEDFNADPIPIENRTGGTTTLHFAPWTNPAALPFMATLGYEDINFIQKPDSNDLLIRSFYDRKFQSGRMLWTSFSTGIDLRNNPVFPTRGYSWNLASKVAIPSGISSFGFYKLDFDGTWLTPVIGESKLIFLLHGHAGIVEPISNHAVPYNELYHIGGLGTVRGFTYGQIGPQFAGSSLGARKAFWVNAELIFSVTDDRSIRGVLFYDGGAAWNTIRDPELNRLLQDRNMRLGFINNNFKYRHAIGFGIRLTQPSPLRIDWGFKLDRNRRLGEKIMEIHFTMMQDF